MGIISPVNAAAHRVDQTKQLVLFGQRKRRGLGTIIRIDGQTCFAGNTGI